MSKPVSYGDFIGDIYPNRKGTLVSIFSVQSPMKFHNEDRDDREDKELVDDDDEPGVKIDIDAYYLRKLFRDLKINAEVEMRYENTKNKIKRYIKHLGTREEDTAETKADKYDAFIFVFLTYLSEESRGKDNRFTDDRIHLNNELCSMQEFYDEVKMTDGMQLKPKIFLVQCDDLSLLYPKVYQKGEEEPILYKIPQDSDRLIIMSDIPQRLANPDITADEKNPSFMIKAFCEALLENINQGPMDQEDLLVLTTTINQKVNVMIKALEDKEEKKQVKKDDRTSTRLNVPLITSTLTKLMIFQPDC